MIEYFGSAEAPPPAGHYSQVVRAGGFVFVAGQVPRDATGHYVTGTIGDETRQALRNVEVLAAAAGATMRDLVRVTAYLTNTAQFAEFDAAYREYVPGAPPVRTTVAVGLRGVQVELEATFYIGV